jgi:predicted nucleic acid-binding protein
VVPLLVRQPASATVDQWIAEEPEIALWTLTPVEIVSALWRLVRDGALDEAIARQSERRAQELAAASHLIIDVEGAKGLATRLLRVHALRAADALQLAASLLWAGGAPQGRTLHTLDERLARAARREGFEVPMTTR